MCHPKNTVQMNNTCDRSTNFLKVIFIYFITNPWKPMHKSTRVCYTSWCKGKECPNPGNIESFHTFSLGICMDKDAVVSRGASSPWWHSTDTFMAHPTSTTDVSVELIIQKFAKKVIEIWLPNFILKSMGSSFLYYGSWFRNMSEAKSVLTYRQFWRGPHVLKLWDLPQFRHCCCHHCHCHHLCYGLHNLLM